MYNLLFDLLPKLLFKFRVERIGKDKGVLLRSLFGLWFTYHEDLSNKKVRLQHKMIKSHKRILQLYSDYLEAEQQQKEMLDMADCSNIETRYRSPRFFMEDSIFPLVHPTVQSPNKDDWEKIENLVKGTLPRTQYQKQLDYIKEIDKKRSKSVSAKDSRVVVSSVSESEVLDPEEIIAANQNKGGNNQQQGKKNKGNNEQHNNNRSNKRGYSEP